MAATLRLSILGGEKVAAALTSRQAGVLAANRKALSDSIQLIHRKISLNLTGGNPLHVQTGRLRQSLQTFVATDGSSATVGTNVEYARIHEYGGTTKPHDIRPRGMALRFATPGFIGPVQTTKKGKIFRKAKSGVSYASVVHHPGATVPARPYMRPALEESKDAIGRIFVTQFLKALKGGAS